MAHFQASTKETAPHKTTDRFGCTNNYLLRQSINHRPLHHPYLNEHCTFSRCILHYPSPCRLEHVSVLFDHDHDHDRGNLHPSPEVGVTVAVGERPSRNPRGCLVGGKGRSPAAATARGPSQQEVGIAISTPDQTPSSFAPNNKDLGAQKNAGIEVKEFLAAGASSSREYEDRILSAFFCSQSVPH